MGKLNQIQNKQRLIEESIAAGKYFCDELGNVYSRCGNGVALTSHCRSMAQRKSKLGYVDINFSANKKLMKVYVHRFVYTYFKGSIPIGMEINHIDGDKTNNSMSNLELVTPSQNSKHAIKLGLKKSPAGHNKMPIEKLSKIFELKRRNFRVMDIARILDIDRVTVTRNYKKHYEAFNGI